MKNTAPLHIPIVAIAFLFLGGCLVRTERFVVPVTSEPDGAAVTLVQMPMFALGRAAGATTGMTPTALGTTPLSVEEVTDGHPLSATTLVVSKDGYETVSIGGPWRRAIHVILKPIRRISLTITSTPAGASVIDPSGSKLGVTPFADGRNGSDVFWPATTFRLDLPGHFPAVVSCQRSEVDVNLQAVLDPFPPAPRDPAFTYPDPEKVVVSPVMLDSRPDPAFAFKPEHTIAIMRLGDRGQEGAGNLAADTMIIGLQRTGRNVVERDRLEQIAREQGLMAEGKTAISDKELAEKLGKLLKADYFMYGAVTEYAAKSEQVSLSPILDPARAADYEREVKAYQEAYRTHNQAAPITAFKSIDQWTMDFASKTKQSYMTVARVGITSKIIEVSTGKIVWVGIASTSDTSLQSGMRRLVDTVVGDITKTGK